jgi:DNA-binding HxlR family transcriptional regulator
MGRVDEDETCSVARSLGVLGERWTFLIVREALFGATRFAEFRERLGVAPDVLSARLATLVEAGVMEKVPYREPGSRVREAYVLTPAGRELQVVLGALQAWGDEHVPREQGPNLLRRHREDGRPVRVAFVDEDGREVAPEDVEMILNPALAAER